MIYDSWFMVYGLWFVMQPKVIDLLIIVCNILFLLKYFE